MIPFTSALDSLLAHCNTLEREPCALASAGGRVLAGPVHSAMALPSFDNAAMDGYALPAHGVDIPANSEFDVPGSQAAGDGAIRVTTAVAWEIMTGAKLPDGLDTVVAVERTQPLLMGADGRPTRIRLLDGQRAGGNVRLTGSDVAPGDEILPAGHEIDAQAIMLLAALGIDTIQVTRAPRVAVICTGKELSAAAGMPLPEGRIHNSNGPYLLAALTSLGADVRFVATVDDEGAQFREAFAAARAQAVDLILTTGAVSAGRYDFVPGQIAALGGTVLFHKVPIRPGKPILAAHFANGPMVVGLPGNPMAVAVGLRFFVVPMLRAWRGLPPERPLRAQLVTDHAPRQGVRQFLKAHVHALADGQLQVRPGPAQNSYRIRSLLDANAWLILDEEAGGKAGDGVDIVSIGVDGRWNLAC